MHVTFGRDGGLEFGHIERVVHPPDLLTGGGGRLVGRHQVEQPAHEQVIVDRRQAFRAFRMAFAHFVAQEARV